MHLSGAHGSQQPDAARVEAAVAHGLYGFLDYLSQQIIYDTAETAYLERWASIFGINRKAAAKATGRMPDDLVQTPIPAPAQALWDAFVALAGTRGGGMGAAAG